MKNRLSTLLIVLLTAFMVTCSNCGTTATDPTIDGSWKVATVDATSGVQARYAQTLPGGTFEIGAVCNLRNAAGAITDGGAGTGAGTITVTDPTSGKLAVAFATNPVTFTYSNLTATTVTLSGNVTSNKTTVNTTTITLTR